MFLDNIAKGSSAPEAGLACAVTALTLDGDLIDVERRIIGLFRDEFPPLQTLEDDAYNKALDNAIKLVSEKNPGANLAAFVQNTIVPSVRATADRVGLYRYLYALAMADLNLSEGETELLKQLQSQLGISADAAGSAEQQILTEYNVMHKALASAVLGLIVVTADGAVQQDEIDSVKNSRTALDTIGQLDDVQFGLIFDLALNIHDRFLLDPENRRGFLANILSELLTDQKIRLAAFGYAAAVATADGNLSTQEVDVMKELLTIMQINDADGERVFGQYMSRVKTIDGKPR